MILLHNIVALAVSPGPRHGYIGIIGATSGCASAVERQTLCPGEIITSNAVWRCYFYGN